MAFTGIFPSPGEEVPTGRLALALCTGPCSLLQLADHFDLSLLYGPHYGYRSGLNASMKAHLEETASKLVEMASPDPGDIWLDIGSSDGTLLAAAPSYMTRIGVDPSAEKFLSFYPRETISIVGFFPNREVDALLEVQKAKVITSIAMFYDLEDPLMFAARVKDALSPDGLWYIEQSYLPRMLEQNAYDTICHEHIEYYALKQIDYIAKRVGFKIVSVGFTQTNGGSFEVVLAHGTSSYQEEPNLATLLRNEASLGLDAPATYEFFKLSIDKQKRDLLSLLAELPSPVWGFGASTKGNVLLQYCKLGPANLAGIYDINEDKNGKVTPGTHIPISSTPPDDPTYVVLPWHFRTNILANNHGKFIFPLPHVEVVDA